MTSAYGSIIETIEATLLVEGPLSGIDFAAKDLFDVAGYSTRAGNPQFAERWGIPTQDAWAIQVLKAAGARLIAKTHTHELAYGMSGINPHYGTPQNPKAPGRIPGGSSSGSAAAVAAGLVPIALGSDTGGSVRIPASLCGIWAYRPTHGLIPLEGVVPLAPSYDTVGLLAQGPELLQRFAQVLLQQSLAVSFERVLLVQDAFAFCSTIAEQATRRIALQLEKQGLRVGEVRLGQLEAVREVQRVLQGVQAWGFHEAWVQEQPKLGADVAHLLQMASGFTSGEIGRALAEQTKLRQELKRVLEPGVLLLMPATPGPAPIIAEMEVAEQALEYRRRTLTLTCFASVLGLPVLTVPAALEGELPIGVQLIGPRRSDEGLLKLARSLTNAKD